MSKKLYVLIVDGQDGSYSTAYTMNEEWIDKMNEKDNQGNLCYPDIGCDGDGFHYNVLRVPDECTLESLGISYDCAED